MIFGRHKSFFPLDIDLQGMLCSEPYMKDTVKITAIAKKGTAS